jgi:hypothetical protein
MDAEADLSPLLATSLQEADKLKPIRRTARSDQSQTRCVSF